MKNLKTIMKNILKDEAIVANILCFIFLLLLFILNEKNFTGYSMLCLGLLNLIVAIILVFKIQKT